MEIHSRIRHENILPLYATFQDEKRVYLILRYASGGDLFKLLHQPNSKQLDLSIAKRYTLQLIRAVQTCHQHHVIHRDIKPENILLSDRKDLLLADFGWSAANVTAKTRRETLCGTLDYLSPEMIQGHKYDASVDVWSIGCVIYEMLTGHPPFEAKEQTDTYSRIMAANFVCPSTMDPVAADLIHKFLQKDPMKRITLSEALQHEWLN